MSDLGEALGTEGSFGKLGENISQGTPGLDQLGRGSVSVRPLGGGSGGWKGVLRCWLVLVLFPLCGRGCRSDSLVCVLSS